MSRTGLVYRDEFIQHDTGEMHPESLLRLKAIMMAIEEAKLDLTRLDIEPATKKDLLRNHIAEHIEFIEECCAAGGGYPDGDTKMMEASWDAALLAAGAGISACKAVLDDKLDNVFCAVRPPGHHAESDRAMGFCLFNNTAIAAHWLKEERGLDRIAILDWDVHHGNGTQESFIDDAHVYYISMHQYPHFPGTGFPHERGKDKRNLNIQFAPGADRETWLSALKGQVVPELERFAPQMLLVSSGFDAHKDDPLSQQSLTTEDFATMTRMTKHIAGGKCVSMLEGGYHLGALADSTIAHIKALME